MKVDFFEAMNEIDDKYVLEAARCIEQRKKDKYFRAISVAATIVFVIVLNMVNPVFARSIPLIGNVFEYLQEKIDFKGKYSNYSSDVDLMVKDNGITVTISDTYCDGENLFVAYQIESELPFSDYTDNNFSKTQLDFDGVMYVELNGNSLEIDDFGVAGLEGEFVDDNTFVGVDTVRLLDGQFPAQFNYEMQVYRWKLILENGSECPMNGYWKLSIPIEINKENVEIIEVNVSEREHTIDRVMISPIMVTVYTSYPEIYNDSVNYEVVVFSNKSDENISFQAHYKETDGKTWIPRERVGDELDIYVVDSSTFTLKGKEAYTKDEIKKHAIVSAHITL